MTNLDSILKNRDITLPTKVSLVKAMAFPVIIYGCESWTIKKAEIEVKVKVAQLCLTLRNLTDYPVHGILQARILAWVAFPFTRGSSWPRNQTQVSHIAGGFFTRWATRTPKIDASELWCRRRLLRVPWTARRSNQSIIKEINPEYSLEGLMLNLKLQYFGHLMWGADSLEKTLLPGNVEGKKRRGQQRMRCLMASLTQRTWVWANSGR